MARSPSSASKVTGGFTALERTVMAALASELGDVAPDLSRQFKLATPVTRKNSGFGVFTEMSVAPGRPTVGTSGEFGAVHAMIGNLADPVAFTVRLQNGRVVGLMGDSYGQDTRSIDFASAPFHQVFTVDASGRSIPFHAGRERQSGQERSQAQQQAPARGSVPASQPPRAASAPITVASTREIQDLINRTLNAPAPAAPTPVMPQRHAAPPAAYAQTSAPAARPHQTPPSQSPHQTLAAPSLASLIEDDMMLRLGVGVFVFFVANLLVVLLGIPWMFVPGAVFWSVMLLNKPQNRENLRKLLRQFQSASAQNG